MKNFLHVDDHEVVRIGVKNVLQDLYKPCNVFDAGDETSALQLLKQHRFDLVIIDVQIPGMDTLGFLTYIVQQYPETKVIAFSMSAETVYAKRFLKVGAMGFVSKNTGLDELKKAIDLALKNRRYISDTLAEDLAGAIGNKQNDNPFEGLSPRELNIATLLIQGKSVSGIATLLNISVSTVATYKARLFEKLRVKNIVELLELGRNFDIS